jgi:hypothetical protein
MSIRFERQPRFCTHLKKDVLLLVEFTAPAGSDSDELTWEQTNTECLERRSCAEDCPGEESVLQKL